MTQKRFHQNTSKRDDNHDNRIDPGKIVANVEFKKSENCIRNALNTVIDQREILGGQLNFNRADNSIAIWGNRCWPLVEIGVVFNKEKGRCIFSGFDGLKKIETNSTDPSEIYSQLRIKKEESKLPINRMGIHNLTW